MRFTALSAALLALVAASCADPLGPESIVPRPRSFPIPIAYEFLWAEIESCSGIRAPRARVRWLYVPNGAASFTWRGDSVGGLWFPDHTIILAEALIAYEPVVRHEMLHDILGVTGHPPRYFSELCGPLV